MALRLEAAEFLLSLAAPAAGEQSELESIVIARFEQLHPRLVRYVLSFGLPHQDAEDIVQETFLALFRHLELGRSRTNLDGWLFRVAHNQALRRRAANQALQRKACGEDVLAEAKCPAPNAEEQVIFSHAQRRLRAVIDALPAQDSQCLFLRSEGLKYRQIAQVLGISLGAVSLSLSRSLARLLRSTQNDRAR